MTTDTDEQRRRSSNSAAKDCFLDAFRSTVYILSIALVLCVVILLVWTKINVSLFQISGSSMEPTMQDRTTVIIKNNETLEDGQIVVFNKPSEWALKDHKQDTGIHLIKRVIALPGDTLAYDGKNLLVNDEIVYQIATNEYPCLKGEVGFEHTLAHDEFFAAGDNAMASLDSRRVFCDGFAAKSFVNIEEIISNGEMIVKF